MPPNISQLHDGGGPELNWGIWRSGFKISSICLISGWPLFSQLYFSCANTRDQCWLGNRMGLDSRYSVRSVDRPSSLLSAPTAGMHQEFWRAIRAFTGRSIRQLLKNLLRCLFIGGGIMQRAVYIQKSTCRTEFAYMAR